MRPSTLLVLGFALSLPASPLAQEPARDPSVITDPTAAPPWEAPLADALRDLGSDVQVFDRHVVTLANPALQGRLPGTPGMEFAKDYCEYWLRQAGLEPAFPPPEDTDGAGVRSWRQPFPLVGTREVRLQGISLPAVADDDARVARDRIELAPGEDFVLTGLGETPEPRVSGSAVFLGYGIDEGPDGWVGYPPGLDLEGRIVVAFHFEPVDGQGTSRWADPELGPWSRKASFARKLRRLKLANAGAVLFVNPPGVDDPRATRLVDEAGGGNPAFGGPVFQLTTAAGDRLLRVMDPEGRGVEALRELADAGNCVVDLEGTLELQAEIGRGFEMVENVGGLLQGRGALKDQLIVVGAHLDHLGTGLFGARDAKGIGQVHPGADDNASGSAGVLMLADKLARQYAALPEDASARSILFVLFTAEESGLHGARHYVKRPIRPLAQHALMTNFDMIGRVVDGELLVAGSDTAEGMEEWLDPLFEQTKLEIVRGSMMVGSDHLAFHGARIPVLFGICAQFHPDYHTPRDVDWKIRRVAAVHTVELFRAILTRAALRPEPFLFTGPGGPLPGVPGRAWVGDAGIASVEAGAKEPAKDAAAPPAADGREVGGAGAGGERGVRFGIMPGYGAAGTGVAVEQVFEGTPAERAGIRAGDRMIRWNGEDLPDARAWSALLRAAKPGDEVEVVVVRGEDEVTVEVELVARGGGDV